MTGLTRLAKLASGATLELQVRDATGLTFYNSCASTMARILE